MTKVDNKTPEEFSFPFLFGFGFGSMIQDVEQQIEKSEEILETEKDIKEL